jgi:hypothetical protein
VEDLPQMQPQVFQKPEDIAGGYANFARVSHSPYEFTLDFIRLDFGMAPPQGIVVSRVSLSPLFVSQLIDALTDNWDKYSKKAMPQEVYRDAEPDAGPSGADPAAETGGPVGD